jgi:hypothetical protein
LKQLTFKQLKIEAANHESSDRQIAGGAGPCPFA